MTDFETVPVGTMQRLKTVEEDRDALAAHVEAGKELKFERHIERALNEWEKTAPATSLARLKAECWKEAYMAGMEHGHHWTVEGAYVPDDEESAEDYVADRQAEESQ